MKSEQKRKQYIQKYQPTSWSVESIDDDCWIPNLSSSLSPPLTPGAPLNQESQVLLLVTSLVSGFWGVLGISLGGGSLSARFEVFVASLDVDRVISDCVVGQVPSFTLLSSVFVSQWDSKLSFNPVFSLFSTKILLLLAVSLSWDVCLSEWAVSLLLIALFDSLFTLDWFFRSEVDPFFDFGLGEFFSKSSCSLLLQLSILSASGTLVSESACSVTGVTLLIIEPALLIADKLSREETKTDVTSLTEVTLMTLSVLLLLKWFSMSWVGDLVCLLQAWPATLAELSTGLKVPNVFCGDLLSLICLFMRAPWVALWAKVFCFFSSSLYFSTCAIFCNWLKRRCVLVCFVSRCFSEEKKKKNATEPCHKTPVFVEFATR